VKRLNRNQASIVGGDAINAMRFSRPSPKRQEKAVNIGFLSAPSAADQYIISEENFTTQNAMMVLTLVKFPKKLFVPKGESPEVEFLGRRVNNVGPNWYIEHCGTFCSVCKVAFTFEESYSILLRCREMGMNHGIPRCVYCSHTLRTRAKAKYESGFWKKVREIENG
jgi:hypothetical protein